MGFMRLIVCGGLFVAGYYLGRQSYRLESEQDQFGTFDNPGAVPEPDEVSPDQQDAGS